MSEKTIESRPHFLNRELYKSIGERLVKIKRLTFLQVVAAGYSMSEEEYRAAYPAFSKVWDALEERMVKLEASIKRLNDY